MPGAVALHFILGHFQGLTLGRQLRVVGQGQLMPSLIGRRLQRQQGKTVVERRQFVDAR
ncbi:hypothetical protein D3C85_1741580 [compost metagenome]